MSFNHSRSLITIPRRSSSARSYRYPEYRDCEFDGYYDYESKIYDWVSKTGLERANLNSSRSQSVPQPRLQDPDYQCKRDLRWIIGYATAFLKNGCRYFEQSASSITRHEGPICSKHTKTRYYLPGIQCPRWGCVCRQAKGRCPNLRLILTFESPELPSFWTATSTRKQFLIKFLRVPSTTWYMPIFLSHVALNTATNRKEEDVSYMAIISVKSYIPSRIYRQPA